MCLRLQQNQSKLLTFLIELHNLIILIVHRSSVSVSVNLQLVHHVLIRLRDHSNQEVHEYDGGHELVAKPDDVDCGDLELAWVVAVVPDCDVWSVNVTYGILESVHEEHAKVTHAWVVADADVDT